MIVPELESTKSNNVSSNKDINYRKRTKHEINTLQALASRVSLESYILIIANAYSKVDNIYFPVRLDQRTRIYCTPEYLNYQSNDLAKSLLSFSKPGILSKDDKDSINNFKSYGALLYKSGFGKNSRSYRTKWVDENNNRILNFRTNDIIDTADKDSRACFVSFCFEYERFIKFMDNVELSTFSTYLPIQLDASCNGYQHISLLTRESKVFEKLNLTPSTKDDKPEDFYNYVLVETKDYINKMVSLIEENDNMYNKTMDSYKRLSVIALTRSMIKKAIMTYGYNAGAITMVDYIKGLLVPSTKSIVVDNKTIEQTIYYIDDSSPVDQYLTASDLFVFVNTFEKVLSQIFPKMKNLKTYTKQIVSICTKLGMAIPWVLPSGAHVKQSYLSAKEFKTCPFAFMKSTLTFKLYPDYVNNNN